MAELVLFILVFLLGLLIGYRRGMRRPLSARRAALRADQRRAENALGATLPRVSKALYSRTSRGDASRRSG